MARSLVQKGGSIVFADRTERTLSDGESANGQRKKVKNGRPSGVRSVQVKRQPSYYSELGFQSRFERTSKKGEKEKGGEDGDTITDGVRVGELSQGDHCVRPRLVLCRGS